ncbi:hypothetical protein FF38_11949, partial [Lucilia cuprina]
LKTSALVITEERGRPYWSSIIEKKAINSLIGRCNRLPIHTPRGVGKTCLVTKYIKNTLHKDVGPTIAASFFTCKVILDDAKVKLQAISYENVGQINTTKFIFFHATRFMELDISWWGQFLRMSYKLFPNLLLRSGYPTPLDLNPVNELHQTAEPKEIQVPIELDLPYS